MKITESFAGTFTKKVYQGEWIPKRSPPIVLHVFNEQISPDDISFYSQLEPHERIVYTFGLVNNSFNRTILIQERAPHGNLQMQLHENRFQPSTKVLLTIFLQITKAMIYLANHNPKIVHGDLRCESVLLFQMHPSNIDGNKVKLTNFYSINDRERMNILVRYCAPEILRDLDLAKSSELSDVYSMGVLMWEAFSQGNRPFGTTTSNDDIRQRRLNDEKLTKPNQCSPQIWTLIEQCWMRETSRPSTFQELQKRISELRSSYVFHCHLPKISTRFHRFRIAELPERSPFNESPILPVKRTNWISCF